MPKDIITTVYNYAELDEEAKEHAQSWYLANSDVGYDAFCNAKNDAENIGLDIIYLDESRTNEGRFVVSAEDCAVSIIAAHGKDCATYKIAKEYLESRNEEKKDSLFLRELLEAYRIMRNADIDYLQSEEAIAESMESNEYTFTEDGTRFG